ncbi:MAG: hypothetical protein AABW51_02580 [Nanoarchaeota archaeon]
MKKILLSIENALAFLLSGLLLQVNIYLGILFLIAGFLGTYYLTKSTPEIISGPEGSSPPDPKRVPEGSIFVQYKK